jgi:UDP-N-acetylglucosamine--N-acetylmuramyl-(pentapeptide) pyrophosphoryl-undecaprenol N-acetylglucosamine transferase
VPIDPAVTRGDRGAAARKYGLDPARPTVLFVGGSLGAQTLNDLAVGCARVADRRWQVLHLCGPRYHDDVVLALTPLPEGVCLRDYEDHMADAYAMADLVVARSGSSTLGELCAVGRAALLVPSPHVAENHQDENARGLESVGAAEVLLEREWDLAAGVARVVALMDDPARLASMAAAAKGQARSDAAERAADLVESLLVSRT